MKFIIFSSIFLLISGIGKGESMREEICLNGEWEYVAGETQTINWKKIRVPHIIPTYSDAFEFGISEQERKNPKFWYKTNFFVPKRFSSGIVKIHFDTVNFYCEVYLNEKLCGTHSDLMLPFEIDVTGAIKFGEENALKIFLQNESKARIGKGEKGEPMFDRIMNGWSWQSKGLTGNVYLKYYPKVYVEDIFVITSVRNKELKIKTWVKNEDAVEHKLDIGHYVTRNKKVELTTKDERFNIKPGEIKEIEISSLWANPALWDIGGEYGEPNLYFLRTVLKENNKEIDAKFTRFGFREFWIEGTDFYLNGKKIYLQGDSPCSGHGGRLYKWNPFFLERFYRILKEGNFNKVRWHQGIVGGALIYEIADEMGILIKPEMVPGQSILNRLSKGDENLRKIVYNQYERWIKSVRNYPCIIMYSADNEATSQCWESIERAEELVKINQFMKTIDPTRPIDNEGDYTLRFDERVDVINLHYPEIDWIKNWQVKYKKPLLLGEVMNFNAYNSFYKDADLGKLENALIEEENWTKANIPLYIEMDIPGICPFQNEWNSFNGNNPGKSVGPWGDLGAYGSNKAGKGIWVDVPWPSLSGPFAKPEKMRAGHSLGYINWFDPQRVEITLSRVYEARKQVFRQMPKIKEIFLSPQVILKIIKGKEVLPEAYVSLIPAENQSTNPVGVKADKEGKSWFILKEPGKYKVEVEGCEILENKEIMTSYRKPNPKPGYDIPIIDVSVK